MEPTTALDAALYALVLVAARQVCEMIAKSIPDSEVGWKAAVRRLFRTLALHIPNKE